MFPYEDSKTVSVHSSIPRKRNHPGFVNISPTLVIDTSMEKVFKSTTTLKPKKQIFFPKMFEFEFCLYPEERNQPGFVIISPTLLIDPSMERC